jgi:Lrp/AsnC family transcriptional regulator, regulator for asnA, asnC and gidA
VKVSDRYLDKTMREVNHFKYKQRLWKDISFQNLAKESNYSYKRFMKHVKYISENKLAKFVVSINYPQLSIYTAFMRVSLNNQRDAEKFKKLVAPLNFIQTIYFIGQKKVTFVLRLRAKSFKHLFEIVHEIRRTSKDMIASTDTRLVSFTHLEERNIYKTNDFLKPKLDDIDFQIIYVLRNNAHTPLSHIAKKVGLREPTVYRRVKKLKDSGIIMGYFFKRNWENIPPKHWPTAAMCEITADVEFKYEKILKLPSVVSNKVYIKYMYETFGSSQLLFSFTTDNMVSYRKFLYDELAGLFGIADIKSYPILEMLNRTVKLGLVVQSPAFPKA